MKNIIYLLLLFSFNAVANDAADDLIQKLNPLQTFSGYFTQQLLNEEDELLSESNGQFLLQKPGMFRWDTLEPFPQLLVSNLKKIWLYDPDLEQVTIRAYDQNIAHTPILLFSGDAAEITENYQVEKVSDQHFRLTPNQTQELFESLSVIFVDGQLAAIHLLDALQQKNIFTFIDGEYNQNIDMAQFEFVPPEGTDIINE